MSNSRLQRDTVSNPQLRDDESFGHSDWTAGVVCDPNPVKITTRSVRYRALGAILVALMLILPRISLASPLYGAGYFPTGGNVLFQIDPATGQISPGVFLNNGGLVVPYDTNIAFAPNGTLYGAGYFPTGGNVLFQIDPATGQISPGVFLNNGGVVVPYDTNIAFAPNGTLYGAGYFPTGGNVLFQIDPATGQISPGVFLNNGGLVVPYDTNIAFAPNGTLYGAGYFPTGGNVLFQIDPATGQISPGVFLNNGGLVVPYDTNIAFAPEANTPIPEPTSSSLLFGVLGLLGTLHFYRTARGRRNTRKPPRCIKAGFTFACSPVV